RDRFATGRVDGADVELGVGLERRGEARNVDVHLLAVDVERQRAVLPGRGDVPPVAGRPFAGVGGATELIVTGRVGVLEAQVLAVLDDAQAVLAELDEAG